MNTITGLFIYHILPLLSSYVQVLQDKNEAMIQQQSDAESAILALREEQDSEIARLRVALAAMTTKMERVSGELMDRELVLYDTQHALEQAQQQLPATTSSDQVSVTTLRQEVASLRSYIQQYQQSSQDKVRRKTEYLNCDLYAIRAAPLVRVKVKFTVKNAIYNGLGHPSRIRRF